MNYIDKIKEYDLPVIIFGASTSGEYAYNICKENGIDIKYFCDNNPDKLDKRFLGIEVVSLEELKKGIILDYLFLIAVIDISDIVFQLESKSFKNWMSCNELLKDVYHHTVSNMVLNHDNYLNADKVFLRGIDLIITERCSLKCKDCSNLMSYYEQPKNYETENILSWVNNLCFKVDKIGEVRIIGGEPFMNKNIHIIIKELLPNDKINNIVIYTNGTILPTEEQMKILNNEKIVFYISDYGSLSRNFSELCEMLIKYNIPYIEADIKWTNCSVIHKNKRSPEKNQKLFDNCCVKNLTTLLDNKLYRCPFFANADKLRAIPDFETDYIDLLKDITKYDIKNYLLDKKYIKACDFCNGRAFDDKEIESAVQIKKALPYKKYSTRKERKWFTKLPFFQMN